jgi:hypothetical protein
MRYIPHFLSTELVRLLRCRGIVLHVPKRHTSWGCPYNCADGVCEEVEADALRTKRSWVDLSCPHEDWCFHDLIRHNEENDEYQACDLATLAVLT